MPPADVGLRPFLAFVGSATLRSVAGLWLLGLVLFGLELAFGFLLQHFVARLGILPSAVQDLAGIELTLARTTVLLACVGLARVGITYAQTLIDGRALEALNCRLRLILVTRTLASPAVDSGRTLTLFHHQILNASIGAQAVYQLILHSVFACGLLIVLCALNWRLSLALLAIAALVLAPARMLHRRARASAARQVRTFSELMTKLGDVFRNLPLIRLYNLQHRERQQFERHLQIYNDDMVRSFHAYGATSALGPLIVIGGIVAIAGAQTSALGLERSITVPFCYLFLRFAQQLGVVSAAAGRLGRAAADLRSTFEWWAREPASNKTALETAGEADRLRSAPGWTLRGVTFAYPGQPPLFSDFSCDIRAGSLVHISGPSGSGKTSLIALLTGEATPQSGTITVHADGREWALQAVTTRLRESLGYASAESYLVAGTLLENVTYGVSEPPPAAFLAAMTTAAGCEFIDELPDGFAHRLDELGHGLSAGQRQRLAMLRALLRRPRVMILDDALSNVDGETEARIVANLRQLQPQCTILWASNRPLAGPVDSTLLLSLRLEAHA